MRSLNRELRQYISLGEGKFRGVDLDQALGIVTPEDKAHRRVILQRLCQERVIQRTKPGHFITSDIKPGKKPTIRDEIKELKKDIGIIRRELRKLTITVNSKAKQSINSSKPYLPGSH